MWTNRPPIQRTVSNTPPQLQRDLSVPSVSHLPLPIHTTHSRASSGQSTPLTQSNPSSLTSAPSIIAHDDNGSTNPFTDLSRPDDGQQTTLVDLVRRLSWDGSASCSSEIMSCNESINTHDDIHDQDMRRIECEVLPSSMGIDVSMYPAPALSTQPPSPILAAMHMQSQTTTGESVLFDGNFNIAHLQPARPHTPHYQQQHRKVASCPFQLGDLIHNPLLASSPNGSPPHDKSAMTQASLSQAFSTGVSSSGSGSGRSSPSTSARSSAHSLLFHPYERERNCGIEKSVNTNPSGPQGSPSSQMTTNGGMPTSVAVHHRPTVISPASRFLSRKLATLPAALVLAKAAKAASPPPPSHSPIGFPPPLSLSINSELNVPGGNMFGHMYGSGCGSSPLSASTGLSTWDSTPPASPQPRLHAIGTMTTNGLPLPHPNAFRTPTSSPSVRPTNSRPSVNVTSHMMMGDSPAYAPSSPMGDVAHIISASSSVSSTGGSHIGMSSTTGGVRRSSYSVMTTATTAGGSTCSSPSASSSSESPLIRPDFSAFDGSGAWTRLSSHSPAKHRSLPGTPLHRPHQGYSVPPTPNARLAKQARSRRSSAGQDAAAAGRNILDAPILMIDYDALATPPTSLPLNVALHANAFAESVYEQEELGSGSFGDVYRVRLTNKPFVYLFGSQTPTIAHSPTLDSNRPEQNAAQNYVYAYKRMRSPFAVLHERTRMLKKYTAIFEMVQNLRQATLFLNPPPPPPPNSVNLSATPDDSVLLSSEYLDPNTFFPRHMVHHYYVWQEHGKLHVLMEFCTRGDLTTYWSVPHHHFRTTPTFSLDDEHMTGEGESESESEGPYDMPRPPLSPLSEKVMWRLILEIGSALALMHRENVLHLDVKPANIFVTESEQFKLGDFDSCVLIRRNTMSVNASQSASGSSTQSSTPSTPNSSAINSAVLASVPGGACLTAAMLRVPIPGFSHELDGLEEGDGLWCAPELLQSMQNATDRADIYSLGVSIYSVLNDEIVRRDDVTGDRILSFQHLKCPISTLLHDTIIMMTHPTPTNRPSAWELMAIATKMLQQPVPESELKLDWIKP